MPGPYVGNPLAGQFGYYKAAYTDPTATRAEGGFATYIWTRVRSDYESRGVGLPAGAFQASNQLFSLAAEQNRAEINLAGALRRQEEGPFQVAIESNMIAPHLDTRALNEMVLGPQHRVVYITQDLVEGEPVLSYKTHDFGYNLPQSIAQLQAVVEDAAQLTAADYGFEWGGVATPVGIYSY